MFRLADSLSGDNVMCKGMKLYNYDNRYIIIFIKKARLLQNDEPYLNQWYGLYSLPILIIDNATWHRHKDTHW
jgi:hypothetical protein